MTRLRGSWSIRIGDSGNDIVEYQQPPSRSREARSTRASTPLPPHSSTWRSAISLFSAPGNSEWKEYCLLPHPGRTEALQDLAAIWISKGIDSVVFPSTTGSGRNVAVNNRQAARSRRSQWCQSLSSPPPTTYEKAWTLHQALSCPASGSGSARQCLGPV